MGVCVGIPLGGVFLSRSVSLRASRCFSGVSVGHATFIPAVGILWAGLSQAAGVCWTEQCAIPRKTIPSSVRRCSLFCSEVITTHLLTRLKSTECMRQSQRLEERLIQGSNALRGSLLAMWICIVCWCLRIATNSPWRQSRRAFFVDARCAIHGPLIFVLFLIPAWCGYFPHCANSSDIVSIKSMQGMVLHVIAFFAARHRRYRPS